MIGGWVGGDGWRGWLEGWLEWMVGGDGWSGRLEMVGRNGWSGWLEGWLEGWWGLYSLHILVRVIIDSKWPERYRFSLKNGIFVNCSTQNQPKLTRSVINNYHKSANQKNSIRSVIPYFSQRIGDKVMEQKIVGGNMQKMNSLFSELFIFCLVADGFAYGRLRCLAHDHSFFFFSLLKCRYHLTNACWCSKDNTMTRNTNCK